MPAMTDPLLAQIPARPGSYVLWLAATRRQRIIVGSLGALAVQPGVYAYAGSAQGPGGLRARLRHHLGVARRLHWHVDYLRRVTQPLELWLCEDPQASEHAWAAALGATAGAAMPLARFGASDCSCPAHLLRFAALPDFTTLAPRVQAATGARRPALRVTVDGAIVGAARERA